jgi:hypothetical protein
VAVKVRRHEEILRHHRADTGSRSGLAR